MVTLALLSDDVPIALHGHLRQRLYQRHGRDEFRFEFSPRSPVLPAILEGQFQLVAWGRGRTNLPAGPICPLEDLQHWGEREEVLVPASYASDNGRWYLVESGFRGILLRDLQGTPHVYLLTEPASHYYSIMCRRDRMPTLVNQRI